MRRMTVLPDDETSLRDELAMYSIKYLERKANEVDFRLKQAILDEIKRRKGKKK